MDRSWIVLKYGGSSVSSRDNWLGIARRVRELLDQGERPLVVCSAVRGISDMLEEVVDRAPRGEHQALVEEILERHRRLASELELDADGLLAKEFDALQRLGQGISLIQEVSPAVVAKVMALGELMSTRLGAAFLAAQGLSIGWCDSREFLTSKSHPLMAPSQRFLSAQCTFDDDPALREKLKKRPEKALLAQGFIAADEEGRTVLLGRGGSDTSAAYLAARLGAKRLEIWTDVPGMFTANPRQIPQARLLKRLDYDEAQELASMGAKVLHPRSIPPMRERQIPLHLRCTTQPEMEHTVISADGSTEGAQVKAISAKKGITVVSMDTLGMWQQVGFLADIFAIFKAHRLSIDLVATSEANVTVTLDPMANALEPGVLTQLKADLEQICRTEISQSCAVISLVGRHIRSILSSLTPALKVFEEHRIYLVSQAASDLNLSLVVDEEQADRLVQQLHGNLFGQKEQDLIFGPRWSSLSGLAEKPGELDKPWWITKKAALLALPQSPGGLYVYDSETLERQARALLAMESVDRIFYAMKANSNREILRRFYELGLGFECVSPGELACLQENLGEPGEGKMLFTPNFAPAQEYIDGFAAGAMVTLDNLHPLKSWPQVFAGREVLVRIDPGQGRGHHRYVRTAGPRSKFGVSPSELPELAKLAEAIDLGIIGLHAHVGSGVRHSGTWSETAVFLESCREYFPDVRILNLGGGLGVPERAGQERLNLAEVDEALQQFKLAHPDLELWLEPGRFLVSEAGVLLARVTQLKNKGEVRYVGLETGMNSLIRPALYGAYHGIVNLSRLEEEPAGFFEVVGPICESGDILGQSRRLPEPREGDVFLIANAGAYGRAMSSHYNLRSPAKEVLI